METEKDEQSDPAAVLSPPPYSTLPTSAGVDTEAPDPSPPPPPYSLSPLAPPTPISKQQQQQQQQPQSPDEQSSQQKDDIIHHLRHTHPVDTLPSLSLRYGIPTPILRQHNNLPQGADHLLAARRTLLIPKARTYKMSPHHYYDHLGMK